MEQPAPPTTAAAPDAIHMIRNAQAIHVQLSAMADHKAGILMGASFVIFALTINQARDAMPPLPLLILGSFAFLSAILTVAAIIPKTKPPAGVPINLLFFGSFTQLSQDEYVERIMAVGTDQDRILRTMAADIYGNGLVLQQKKYRLLAYAYGCFLAGLVGAAIAFVATRL